MVSKRCKVLVQSMLDKLSITYNTLELGVVDIKQHTTPIQLALLKQELLIVGLVLLKDKKEILIEKIKNVVIDFVHCDSKEAVMKNSVYISEKMKYDYTYLANLFSQVTGATIESFIIIHKVERVKELLLYNELSISEISYKLNYSSVAHLSTQFKKITGLTPSFFKKSKNKFRLNLEDV